MENVTSTNQMPSSHASDTLPNTAGLSVTDGVPNTSTTSNMPSGTTGSANVQVADKTSQSATVPQSNIDTAKHAKLDTDSSNTDGSNTDGSNKDQLRRRVMQRESDLSKALSELEGNEERRIALQGAIDAGRDVLKTGWEHIGEVEAAQLSRWLETSETLVLQGSPAETAPESAKVADQNKPANTAEDQPAVKA